MRSSVLNPVRADAWWEHKLSPILATMYATAGLVQAPFASLFPAIALALAALTVCASYVSVLNDLTDADDDRASGKPNRWMGASRVYPLVLLAACVAGGAGFLTLWRADTLVSGAYLCSWLAFTLYSVPPCRLKGRGIWGVLAEACGAHLFPTLFAVFLLYRWSGTAGPARWTIAVALWAIAGGIRGILRHQIEDAASDATIGLRTFAALHGTAAAQRLGLLAFVLELAGFIAMLWISRGALASLFLVLYGGFAVIRWRRLRIRLSVVQPRQSSRTAMEEFYIVLYPLAYLLAASWRQPFALLVLSCHAVLFSRQAVYMAHDVVTIARISAAGRGIGKALQGKTRS